jgi:hypothetical protein
MKDMLADLLRSHILRRQLNFARYTFGQMKDTSLSASSDRAVEVRNVGIVHVDIILVFSPLWEWCQGYSDK